MYPRKPLTFLAISMLALSAGEAFAACSFSSSSMTTTTLTLPSLTLSRNTPVGTMIYDSNWQGNQEAIVNCTTTFSATVGFSAPLTLTTAVGMPNVYETGIPGIGIKAAYSNTANASSHPTNIDAVNNNGAWLVAWPTKTIAPSAVPTTYKPTGIYRVQLFVTGPLSQSGTFSLPTAVTKYDTLMTNQLVFAGGGIQLTVKTCTVKDKLITVELPRVQINSLPNIGSTAGATGFNLSVTCDSGVTVGYQIDGTAAPGTAASNGILAIDGGAGQATGVGIQIQNSTPAPVPLGSLVNSQLKATFDGQLIQVPLTAYYYRTGTPVTAGAVKATATFTMSYL